MSYLPWLREGAEDGPQRSETGDKNGGYGADRTTTERGKG